MIPTLLGVAILLMLRVMGGDPVETMLRGEGANVSQAVIEQERTRLGSTGRSTCSSANGWAGWRPAISACRCGPASRCRRRSRRGCSSPQVAVMATVLAILISIPLGTLSALYKDTWIDHVIRVISIAGLAVPSFWLGMIIILVLLSYFHWHPPITFTPFFENPRENLAQLIWPALAVGYRYSAVATRMMRSTLLEVLQEDYIRTARAKGVFERLVSPARCRMRAAGGDRDRPRVRLPDRRARGDGGCST
jgi:peptide/nickel transport system permease protein